MGLFDQFPYANFHEMNLDWIINEIIKLRGVYDNLQKEIQDTIDFVNNFEKHADELIDERIAIQLSLYDQRINNLQKQIDDIVDELNKDDGVLGMLEAMGLRIDDLQNQINNLNHMLNDEIFKLLNLMHEYKHDIDTIIAGETAKLEQYIYDNVTKLDRLDVINPITGVFEDIQNVLNDIVAIVSNSYGITAGQYDSLHMTAFDYDAMHITAEEYSTKGYFQLYLKLTFALVRNPFTGLIDTFQNVLDSLTELHKCALTAIEYDERALTAEEYDSMMLSAFDYDWFGFLVVTFILAKLYDKLELSAEKYDSKELTAAEYDRGMIVLTDTCLRGCKATCGDYVILARQITELQRQIAELESQYDTLDDERITAGQTWAGIVDVGDNMSYIPIPIVHNKSVIRVVEDWMENPSRISVLPYQGVVLEWPNAMTETRSFTLSVADKY